MKQLVEYGVAAHHFTDAQQAHSHTYMTRDGRAVSTPLVFPENPYNGLVMDSKVILDLGCGTGRNLPWIMENTNARYLGIDPNPSMRKFFWELQDNKYKDRALVVADFDDADTLAPDPYKVRVDVVVCTFVFQHIGFRPPEGQMNVADITNAVKRYCHKDTVWIMYEHDWEEQWIGRWMDECDILPQVFIRDWAGIPELAERKAHHLIIWKER